MFEALKSTYSTVIQYEANGNVLYYQISSSDSVSLVKLMDICLQHVPSGKSRESGRAGILTAQVRYSFMLMTFHGVSDSRNLKMGPVSKGTLVLPITGH